ncbi:MAG: diguanylate cyclase [Candidatus Thiodiazotropha sp.]
MTRQIGEMTREHDGIQLHITSLDPIRPENAPSELERLALLRFDQGDDEYSGFIAENGESKFFYMAPLTTTRGCLKCHESQGYDLGDIRGRNSVTFPHTRPADLVGIMFAYLAIGAVGTLLIGLLARKLTRAYETVRQQAIVDPLTGIANRRYCIEHLALEYRRARRDKHPLFLLVCDIDYFKRYNDAYGHLAGDNCLKRVANTISEELRRGGAPPL